MREKTAKKPYNRWTELLLLFDFTLDNLPGSKMELLYYFSRDPQQEAANVSTYDEQFFVA